MANTVLVQTKCTAMDVDAYNRSAVAEKDIPNGTPLVCEGISEDADKKQVFAVKTPTGVVKDVWLAYSPEVVITQGVGGNQFTGIDVDPRNFTNIAGRPFDIFKPVAGVDLIQVTTPFFKAGNDPKTISGAKYVELQADGTMAAKTTATGSFAGLQFKILTMEPIIIANGTIGGEAVDAWILECTIN